MRLMDVLLAFPPIVLALLAVSAHRRRSCGCSCLAVAVCNMPYTARA